MSCLRFANGCKEKKRKKENQINKQKPRDLLGPEATGSAGRRIIANLMHTPRVFCLMSKFKGAHKIIKEAEMQDSG